MPKFQVWLRGSDLCDVTADTEEGARQQIRDFYGYKRLPKDTFVCRIPDNYYNQMVRNNREIGIDASNI
ncbi:MAG: hypothetical protein E3J76_03625 [Candidatus Aminicenantes bacterium]|nr:MAG: hypothetical protein E3J76_03625 [Candidatus Aminicenantes bacterium]